MPDIEARLDIDGVTIQWNEQWIVLDCDDEHIVLPRSALPRIFRAVENDPANVFVVLVDWGTMDGFKHLTQAHSCHRRREDAETERDICKNRSPFPAFSAEVVEIEVKQ